MVNLKMSYDVAVIGLGPAGASSLYYASFNGLRAVGFDKRRKIGEPVKCGEFLPHPSEYKHLLPNAKHVELLTNIPTEIVRNNTKRVSIYSPRGVEYEIEFNGYVIDRANFDKWIVSKALDSGAEVMAATEIRSLVKSKDGYVVRGISINGRSVEVKSKFIILATGIPTKLLNDLNMDVKLTEHDTCFTIQSKMSNVVTDADKVEMYVGKSYAPGAYAWIIPCGDGYANVGLGVRKPFVAGGDERIHLRSFLDKFVREHPVASTKLRRAKLISLVSKVLPVGPPVKTVGDRAYLVGDVANHVIASIGAGVPTSVIAGSIAGESVARFLNNSAPIHVYEETWRKEIGDALERGYRIRQVIDALVESDEFVEIVLRLFKFYIKDIIRLKEPAIVRLARRLPLSKLARLSLS